MSMETEAYNYVKISYLVSTENLGTQNLKNIGEPETGRSKSRPGLPSETLSQTIKKKNLNNKPEGV